ncbi:MAG: rod shape-determining protein RodA [Acidimicrobiia bacterium]
MSSVVLSDRRARVQTSPLRHLDLALLGAAFGATAIGQLMIYSSTQARTKAAHVSALYFVERQLVATLLGLFVMAAVMAIDYRKIRDHAILVYLATVSALLVVLSPFGSNAKGAQSWIQLPGGFQFQPSELAKLGLIIGLAGYLAQHRDGLDARRVLTAVGIAGVPMALVMLQPDLGTTLVMGVVVLAMLTIAGARPLHLLVIVLVCVTCAVLVVQRGILKQYQVDRLTAFLDQSSDSSRATYNLNQSKTAIGNGGLFGRGYRHGTQTNLAFVPEQHTDFIFTALGEELGFVGGATLLALFAIVVWRTWRTALVSPDFFGTIVCIGVLAFFVFQVFENMGMTMGIMPITGIPLPFMSYGGSAIITEFACLGLVANVSMRRFT